MMKKFNFKYLIPLIILFVLLIIPSSFNKRNSITFYGFAENKETEIRLENSVEILKINVTTGQEVKKGAVLLDVLSSDLPLKINEIKYKIQELKSKYSLWKNDLDWKINQYKIELNEKSSKINSEISIYTSQLQRNKLFSETINTNSIKTNIDHPILLKVKSLKNELNFIRKLINTEIKNLKSQRFAKNNPLLTKIKSLETEISFFNSKKERQTIIATSNGLIGNVNCKEKEFFSSFTTLLTIYEGNPKLVKSFIHEDLLLKININDTIDVISSSRPEINYKGIVKTLGSRIIEIPERLRRFKEIKTFGREVIIEIPSNNLFLQKEKVTLKRVDEI